MATDVAAEPLERFTDEQVESFWRDGFLIVEEGLIAPRALERLRERYLPLFEGEYETGIRPDEVNWVKGRDPEDRTRQLCNAWKSDTVIAAQVLSARIGRLAAQLMGYEGVRILQDNVLWKPPGTKAIGFHQDGSYADYLVPPEMVTCWMSLARDGRGRRADRLRPRLEPLGRLRRPRGRSSTRRRTGWPAFGTRSPPT